MSYSSEALKLGITPGKVALEMTEKELEEFLSTIESDMMGFDGREGMELGEDVCP